MKVINKSRKIIAIGDEPLLPGNGIEIPEALVTHPSIVDYLKRGVLVDVKSAGAPPVVSVGVSDAEKTRIAEEAIAKYKAEQEEAEKIKANKEAEIKAVKAMKKEDLITKAMGMGMEVKDSETADILREKIIAALNE